ncbi:aldo/keto reductase [Bifidobacterium pullorum]|uniref:aldo/keto reductase n=1 Tax=Bifidobacterium pullorum TaxID=78448 RepID=UPI0025A4152F|nr:aldo/keto reductase [Bifidobacterium pullorum]MDM8322265.1 aldo/keto reductase [Bifidobacterium pullorum]
MMNAPEQIVEEQTRLTLNDGNTIPQFGFGTYMIEGDVETEKVCSEALSLGYRHIDTAHAYQNERGVGEAVRKSGIPREDVWVTSKLWPSEYGEGVTSEAIDKMLDRLGTGYIDLLLLHQQFGDYMGAWKDMERAVKDGRVGSIGLSNFESDRLEQVLGAAEIKPSVLQVECHPYYPQRELRKRIAPYGTVIECWYPLGHGDKGLLGDPTIVALAEKYGKSPAQIILRWDIQEGNIVIPKTLNTEHMAQNIDVFDFELTEGDMESIANMDSGTRYFTLTLEQQENSLSRFVLAD